MTAPLLMSLAIRDTAYHTYQDYLTWPDDVRYELIDGVAYMMAPAPLRVHQDCLLQMSAQVVSTLRGRPCRPFIAPLDVRLPRLNEADSRVDTVVQPDLLVVCDPAKIDERGVRGAPDWVVEVLSPSTASYDMTIKLATYERAGVPEVWLVHPVDGVVTVYRLENGRYGRPDVFATSGELAVGSVTDLKIDWSLVFPNELGQ